MLALKHVYSQSSSLILRTTLSAVVQFVTINKSSPPEYTVYIFSLNSSSKSLVRYPEKKRSRLLLRVATLEKVYLLPRPLMNIKPKLSTSALTKASYKLKTYSIGVFFKLFGMIYNPDFIILINVF